MSENTKRTPKFDTFEKSDRSTNNHKLSDIKYGLIAVDPMQEGEMKDVLHFCGYWEEPGKREAQSLLDELKTDESFGLTDIADRLVIIPAPHDILEYYINEAIQDEHD